MNVGGDFDRSLRWSVWHHLGGILAPSPERPDRWLGRSKDEDDTGVFRKVILLSEPHEPTVEITPNAVAFELHSIDTEPAEIGSRLVRGTHALDVDIYAENDTIGRMLRGDILGALAQATLPIFDGETGDDATPTILGYMDFERVRGDKAHGFSDAWRRHWFTVSADLEI